MFGFFFRKKLKIDSRAICDRGLARGDNQDCIFEDPERGLFCVADGMGGGEAGGLASKIVCEEVYGQGEWTSFDAQIVAADSALLRANRRIREHAAAQGFASMGSTVAALLFDVDDPTRAAVVHVGDSRVYRRRDLHLERLTEDHRASAYSHLLTRAVGGADAFEPEWLRASVRKGDVWIVCSDGVHEMIPDSTINALIACGGNASDIALRIEASVRKAGARDNYSLIVVRT